MRGDVHQVRGRDPHDVLDVSRGADRQQVIQAFRRKVRSGGHPDTGGDARAFEEYVRARDALLERMHTTTHEAGQPRPQPRPRPAPQPSAAPAEPRPDRTPRSTVDGHERPDDSPPTETSKLAIVTVVLAALGPLFWPFAIVLGHLAMRQIKRTGQGGGTVVPIVLLFLYIITLPVLARVLSMMLIP